MYKIYVYKYTCIQVQDNSPPSLRFYHRIEIFLYIYIQSFLYVIIRLSLETVTTILMSLNLKKWTKTPIKGCKIYYLHNENINFTPIVNFPFYGLKQSVRERKMSTPLPWLMIRSNPANGITSLTESRLDGVLTVVCGYHPHLKVDSCETHIPSESRKEDPRPPRRIKGVV